MLFFSRVCQIVQLLKVISTRTHIQYSFLIHGRYILVKLDGVRTNKSYSYLAFQMHCSRKTNKIQRNIFRKINSGDLFLGMFSLSKLAKSWSSVSKITSVWRKCFLYMQIYLQFQSDNSSQMLALLGHWLTVSIGLILGIIDRTWY